MYWKDNLYHLSRDLMSDELNYCIGTYTYCVFNTLTTYSL
jgi:hypothetical protein